MKGLQMNARQSFVTWASLGFPLEMSPFPSICYYSAKDQMLRFQVSSTCNWDVIPYWKSIDLRSRHYGLSAKLCAQKRPGVNILLSKICINTKFISRLSKGFAKTPRTILIGSQVWLFQMKKKKGKQSTGQCLKNTRRTANTINRAIWSVEF